MRRHNGLRTWMLALALLLPWTAAVQATATPAPKQQVVVSTDIGDDIDDAFALALLLRSPEFNILGVASTWGDTALRARLIKRYLQRAGRSGIPVAIGTRTTSKVAFTQARWARRQAPLGHASDAAAMILDQARRHPGKVTLLVLGPLTDAAEAATRDPALFAKLRRIVLMGGSIHAGYGDADYRPATPPVPEYNIASDIDAARKVFTAGVPIIMLPLDATQVDLEEDERIALFAHGDALTDALTQLYYQWRASAQPWTTDTPTLFDVVPVAWVLEPSLCPTRPMRIAIDAAGYTRQTPGPANARVCLKLDKPGLIALYMRRLLHAPTRPRSGPGH